MPGDNRDRGGLGGYFGSVAALAPATALKSLTDLPKGAVDQIIENLAAGRSAKVVPTITQAFSGRGLGRAMGAFAPALFTTPFLFEGARRLQTADTAGEKAKALSIAAIPAALYGFGKGSIEAGWENRGSKEWLARALGRGQGRALTSTLALAPMIMGIGEGQKRKDENPMAAYAFPLLGGAVGGAAKGGIERILENRALRKTLLEGVGPAMAGRAAAGALGGLALGKIMEMFGSKGGGGT